MAPLRLGEGNLRDQPSRLLRVVIRDRRLEVLPLGRGLPQLAAKPAEQAHGRLVGHGVHATACRIYALAVDLRSVDELETVAKITVTPSPSMLGWMLPGGLHRRTTVLRFRLLLPLP